MAGVKYYLVIIPGKNKFSGSTPLTYSSGSSIEVGSLISIPYGKSNRKAVVYAETTKPKFATKEIGEVLLPGLLSRQSLGLIEFISKYFVQNIGATTELFINSKIIKRLVEGKKNNEWLNNELEAARNMTLLPEYSVGELTDQQLRVNQNITVTEKNILRGETGSGKTEIYLRQSEASLRNKKNVLILIPEINLSPQNIKRFSELKCPIIVHNSRITELQRARNWMLVRSLTMEKINFVIIGPRSAIFLPIADLGLVIIDEFHDSSFKQINEPKFNSLVVGAKLAGLHNAKIILGSATPNVSDYYLLQASGYSVHELSKRMTQQVNIEIADLSEEPGSIFTKDALKKITIELERKKQVLVFHNRRGNYRIIRCEHCSWSAQCPNCILPIIYHEDEFKLKCHACGYKCDVINICPKCKSPSIVFKMFGTKEIENFLRKKFPEKVIKRFDQDNIKIKDKLDSNYNEISEGKIDVIIGTKIITKGLDIRNLNLVVVPLIETELQIPDPYSRENAYQILSQVIGRVGRGHNEEMSQVVLQTYSPNNPLLTMLLQQNWLSFYKDELNERKLKLEAPYKYELKVWSQHRDEARAKLLLEELVLIIKKLEFNRRLMLLGPDAKFIIKDKGRFNYQLIIKSSFRGDLTQIAEMIINDKNIKFELDPINFL